MKNIVFLAWPLRWSNHFQLFFWWSRLYFSDFSFFLAKFCLFVISFILWVKFFNCLDKSLKSLNFCLPCFLLVLFFLTVFFMPINLTFDWFFCISNLAFLWLIYTIVPICIRISQDIFRYLETFPDRRTNRQTDRQIDIIHTYIQTDRQTDKVITCPPIRIVMEVIKRTKKTHTHTHTHTYIQTDTYLSPCSVSVKTNVFH